MIKLTLYEKQWYIRCYFDENECHLVKNVRITELKHVQGCVFSFKVNRLVGKGCTWSNDMTVAEVKSNLRKKFYFFPGIHGNPPELFKDKKSE